MLCFVGRSIASTIAQEIPVLVMVVVVVFWCIL